MGTAIYRGDPNRMRWSMNKRPSRAKSPRRIVKCIDGPLAGEKLSLTDGITMVFKMYGQRGRYVAGRWEQL